MNITKLYLLDTPLEKDYRNTLYFANKNAQTNYFKSKIVKSYTDFSYQRKDNLIRVPAEFDDIINCNYVMYQNTAQSNKWYYAFIEKMEYISEGRTDIYISTDVIQTYLFDYHVQPSFIEREHVDDDALGKHTIPEGLELGEYKVLSHLADSYNNQLTIVMASTCDPITPSNNSFGNLYTGVPSGIAYYRFDNIGAGNSTDPNTLYGAINNINTAGRIDAIQALFMCPKWLANNTVGNVSSIYVTPSAQPVSQDLGISRISALDGYTPHNKKLLTFPYCYIEVSNNIGQATTFMQERWNLDNNNEMVLRMSGCLTPGASIRCYPLAYNGDGTGFDDGISLGKFPSLNWNNDQYTNWLTQNGVNIGCIKLNAEQVGYIKAGANLALGAGMIASGIGVAGGLTLAGGVSDVLSTMTELYHHQLVPNTAEGNLNSGDITTILGANRFHCYRKSIKQEYAKIIDKYLDMFGYKVSTVKVPNSNHRQNWWYTKTIGCNITGAIPNQDLDKIKACYNNGITFWKNPANIYDYTQSNNIVTS